jgi:hypothetical protein
LLLLLLRTPPSAIRRQPLPSFASIVTGSHPSLSPRSLIYRLYCTLLYSVRLQRHPQPQPQPQPLPGSPSFRWFSRFLWFTASPDPPLGHPLPPIIDPYTEATAHSAGPLPNLAISLEPSARSHSLTHSYSVVGTLGRNLLPTQCTHPSTEYGVLVQSTRG